MAATNGTLILKGLQTGKTYSVDMYIPDAVATKVCFSGSGLAAATSNEYIVLPEDCIIEDLSAVGAPTAVGAFFTANGGQVSNECIRWANQANSLATRPAYKVPVGAGVQLGMTQF